MVSSRPMAGLTDAQNELIAARNASIREEHHRIREDYPEHSQPSGSAPVEKMEAHRKRLIYRSKQRGWLELDLVLGSWATKHVSALNESQLREYEDILNQETIDIYKWITAEQEVPEEFNNSVMDILQKYALTSPAGQASPEAYMEIKKIMSN